MAGTSEVEQAVMRNEAGRRWNDEGQERCLFDEAFARYHSPVYAYLCHMIGCAEEGQTLTQEVFAQVYEALRTGPAAARPTAIYRLATRAAFRALGCHRWRLVHGRGGSTTCRGVAPSCACSRRVLLDRLTPPERACLLLRTQVDLPIEDIADALGWSRKRTLTTLRRAKERACLVMQDDGVYV